MKKIKLLLLFINLIFLSNSAFSHGICRNRNSCSGSWNTPWMYKAHVRVSKWGRPRYRTDKDCPYGGGGDGACSAYRNNGCAWQYALNDHGNWYFSGSVYRHSRVCSRGFSSSELYYDLLGSIPKESNDHEESDLKTKGTRFEKSAVYIDDITGFLTAKGNDTFSSFEVIMWLPSNDNDSIMSEKKVFFKGKIELSNGKVNVTGDFPKNSYKIFKSDNGEYTVKFSKLDIKASLPKGVNGKSDLIEVVGISDGGTVEKNIITNTIKKTENSDLTFSIHPNPSSDIITIQLNTNSKESYQVKLFDISGKKIKTLSDNVKFDKKNKYTFNLSNINLDKGVYFILLESNNDTYLKKIVFK